MIYRVLKITNNVSGYPECKKDTEEFPYLVQKVEDEMDLFIVDENGTDYPANEFFYMVSVEEFQAV